MRNRFVLLADIALIGLAAFGAFVLRLDWFFTIYRDAFQFYVLAALILKPPVFVACGLYARYWRYASVRDFLLVAVGVTVSAVALSAVVSLAIYTGHAPWVPRSVLFIDWVLTLALVAGVRFSIRVLAEARERRPGVPIARMKRVLVAGAGEAGALVVREMQRNPDLGMLPVGFLDDAPAKKGKRIHGIQVLGSLAELTQKVRTHSIDEVVIAMPKVGGSVVRTIVEECRRGQVPAVALPGVYELLDGKVSVSRLRRVEISDLLRRAPVTTTTGRADYLQGRVVLVTGAGGSIGSELSRQIAAAGASTMVLLGHGENSVFEIEAQLRQEYPGVTIEPIIADIRDADRIRRAFERHRPSVVFHAAAHKHVPLMESNPEEAVTNNVLGTLNVVEAATEARVDRFVLISTDKAVRPISVMGATKRVAEMIVQQTARRPGAPALVVVRFGNVLGSRGSVVPYFNKQIERGGPVTVTHPEMRRFFMTIPEAVHLVIQAGGKGTGGELFVLNMGSSMRIVDLAQDLIRLSGFTTDEIQITYTGLRPGEKLDEQLWEEGATIEPTDSPEILKVTEPHRGHEDLWSLVQDLSRFAKSEDPQGIRRLLATATDRGLSQGTSTLQNPPLSQQSWA